MASKNFEFDKNKTFIIAEAGSNWKCGTFEDDLKRAYELIDIAAKSGADAVKFQTYKPETTYVKNAGNSSYLEKNDIHENINKIFDNLLMHYEMIPELANHCEKRKINFMSTAFSVQDAKQLDPFVTIHKVASFEINHIRLLEFLAKTKKPIIISTGASNYTEINFSLELVKSISNSPIALLQCTSKYPASLKNMNLEVIRTLKEKYHLPVGLSDHSLDPIISPLTAIGLGAQIIEKHFTLNRNLPGPDHAFALEPDELNQMIKAIRKAELALGNKEKEILEEEQELRNFATRSIQAISNISKGEILQEGKNFDILRPGNRIRGLDARFLKKIDGKKAIKDIEIGDGITDFE